MDTASAERGQFGGSAVLTRRQSSSVFSTGPTVHRTPHLALSRPFCTSVKALKSDYAVLGSNSSCLGSSKPSITSDNRDADKTPVLHRLNHQVVSVTLRPLPYLHGRHLRINTAEHRGNLREHLVDQIGQIAVVRIPDFGQTDRRPAAPQ
jgi:hypothetical protein